MELGRVVNWVEVFLWGMIGVAFAWRAISGRVGERVDKAVLAVSFLAFGVSDYVELRTGTWWEPWWLPVWKVACVLVFVWAFIRFRKRRSDG